MMGKELLDALTRLKEHLEKDFDADNYVKGEQAEKDIADIKAILDQDQDLPAPPQGCQFNHYMSIHKTCEKCDKNETCSHFKEVYKQFKKAEYECFSAPYAEGRYNGD